MKNPEVAELLSINADNLKQKQYDALKAHGIAVLQHIINLLKKDKLDDIEPLLFYSPAGDDMGCDNNCIDFNWTDSRDNTDISEFVSNLKHLQSKKK